ncbi:MAG TPA: hypothetical protein VFE18_13950 [Phenylobacterium sp.]|jgi:hypothetical protein|uniref:hypothetical protein n=1 Tax=Phenylobacterium sp. TaxID=1871053 RepID=UPI002D3CC562|nr:hypothetical protein [Phenylobacterium sp.]HZZ69272.1 hypothetical protein [Phenylobacterium sp.]
MSETRRFTDLAQRFARLAAMARTPSERDDYHEVAAAYLQLAKGAAAVEVGGVIEGAAAAEPELEQALP